MQGSVAVPEVVIDELMPHYKEALTKTMHGLRQISREPLDVSERIEAEYQEYLVSCNRS
jgi:hypothetical protein